MTEGLKAHIAGIIKLKSNLADDKIIILTNEISKAVDEEFGKVIMQSLKLGEILEAAGLKIVGE